MSRLVNQKVTVRHSVRQHNPTRILACLDWSVSSTCWRMMRDLVFCFRCKGNWNVVLVGNWSSNGLIVSALASSVKLTSRRGCSFCNYRLLKGFISYRNLFDFLLRLVVLKRLGFQSQKYGMLIYTTIVKFYAVCFWIRDNQRYSKTRYISTRRKSMLYRGLSHVQL